MNNYDYFVLIAANLGLSLIAQLILWGGVFLAFWLYEKAHDKSVGCFFITIIGVIVIASVFFTTFLAPIILLFKLHSLDFTWKAVTVFIDIALGTWTIALPLRLGINLFIRVVDWVYKFWVRILTFIVVDIFNFSLKRKMFQEVGDEIRIRALQVASVIWSVIFLIFFIAYPIYDCPSFVQSTKGVNCAVQEFFTGRCSLAVASQFLANYCSVPNLLEIGFEEYPVKLSVIFFHFQEIFSGFGFGATASSALSVIFQIMSLIADVLGIYAFVNQLNSKTENE